jgi:hypothetical protein
MWFKEWCALSKSEVEGPVTVVMGRKRSVWSIRGKECVCSISPMRSRRHVQVEQNVTSERRLSARTRSQTENTNGDANGVMCQGRKSDEVKVDDARPSFIHFHMLLVPDTSCPVMRDRFCTCVNISHQFGLFVKPAMLCVDWTPTLKSVEREGAGETATRAKRTCRLKLFRQIVQQKVQQHCIDFCFGFWMILDNLPSDHFHCPDTAATELHLPAVTTLQLFLLTESALQWRRECDNAEVVQHLGNPVI